jgi:predicted O-methyltransferase YrrM
VAEVMTDRTSLAHVAPLARMLAAAGARFHDLVDAYRADTGVSWEDFGVDMRESQSDMNRPWFEHELAGALAGTPIAPLLARPDASIADVGCGGGWSSIALAVAHPDATVVGYDVDAPSIEAARRHASKAGVSDRVRFHLADAAEAAQGEPYDAVTAFECIHDMPDPISVLRRMRELVADDGVVLVMDEAVGDAFGQRNDEVERLMYGVSLFVCLPDGMSHAESVGTGTVMRPATLLGYARDAGFTDLEVLPIENDLWRFYRLRQ